MIIRQSHVVLIVRLIGVEILLASIYLLVRIPKTVLISFLSDATQNSTLNFISVGYFIALSLLEMALVLKVALGWANNVYEIRDDSIIHRHGVFTLREDAYTLRNLGSATIQQDFWGKLFNYGTIILSSPILKHEFFLTDIHNPKNIAKTFDDNIADIGGKNDIIRSRA